MNDTLACAALEIWTEHYENQFNTCNFFIGAGQRAFVRARVHYGKHGWMRRRVHASATGQFPANNQARKVDKGATAEVLVPTVD